MIYFFKTKPGQMVHVGEEELDGGFPILIGRLGVGDYVRIPPGIPGHKEGEPHKIVKTERLSYCEHCNHMNTLMHTVDNGLRINECGNCGFQWLRAICKGCNGAGVIACVGSLNEGGKAKCEKCEGTGLKLDASILLQLRQHNQK